MEHILFVDACMRGPEQSRTLGLCRRFLSEYTALRPESQVVRRDLTGAELPVMTAQLARQRELRRRILHVLCIALCAGVVLAVCFLVSAGSPYLDWDYRDPETAVMGTALHALEWLFVRLAPVLLIGAAAGAFLTRRRA